MRGLIYAPIDLEEPRVYDFKSAGKAAGEWKDQTMTVDEIFEKAYTLMDEPVIEGNCGLLCNYHCCRDDGDDGEKMGIYLLPLEYESMIKGRELEKHLRMTRHTNKVYEMQTKIKSLKEQIHHCPLLKQEEIWRPEFVRGVYEGWKLLITIPLVRYLIDSDSRERNFDEIETKIKF